MSALFRIFATCFFGDTTLYLLKFPLESPPRKRNNEQYQTRFGVRTKSASSPYLFGACGEPERDMAGAHSFHIRELVLTVKWKGTTLVLIKTLTVMKELRFLLLVTAICLASGVKAQFYDGPDDIYYYVISDDYGNPLNRGLAIVFNFDGKKACDLSGYLYLKKEYDEDIECYILARNSIDDVKKNIQTNVSYYEDKVENTEYKVTYVSGNKYQGTTNTYRNGNFWMKETHTFDFSYDRKTMTDIIERACSTGNPREIKKFVKVEKSFFRVGRSRTPSGTMHE